MSDPHPLVRGDRLPDIALPSASGTGTVRLCPGGRLNPVIVALHGGGCDECRAWLDRLAASADALREWDAHVVVIVPEIAILLSDMPFVVAVDADGVFAARTGLRGAAVLIADQWGEVAHATDVGEGHGLPEVGEIVEWVQFLATQCPECEGEAL
jgi:hypothetical protein